MIEKKNTIEQFRAEIGKMEGQFKMVLPPHISVDKFMRVTLTAIQTSTENLLECDRQSLFSSALKCASDGLLPDGRQAAFAKFNSKQGPKVQYMPMIGGIYKKVRQSGEIVSLTSQIVHKNDKFRYWVNSEGEHIDHEPLLFGERGERIGVYAIAKLKDGGVEIEPLTEKDVMAVKAVSKSRDSGPWSGPFESEMWRKTAIRRLSKRLPLSADIAEVIERDDEMYEFNQHQIESSDKISELQKKLHAPVEAPIEEPIVVEKGEFNDFQGSFIPKMMEDPMMVK